MDREIYIEDERVALTRFDPGEDGPLQFDCWQDPQVQAGYNYRMELTREQFLQRPIRSRFLAAIRCKADGNTAGFVFLSPEHTPPDLAIMLCRDYRGRGYGTAAFRLALQYCFEVFSLEEIYAGCYEHNAASLNMLKKCGFVPHPEGNQEEKHYLDDSPVTQFDYVKRRGR